MNRLSDEQVEEYIKTLHYSAEDYSFTQEEVSALVAGNIRTFANWVKKGEEVPDESRPLIKPEYLTEGYDPKLVRD